METKFKALITVLIFIGTFSVPPLALAEPQLVRISPSTPSQTMPRGQPRQRGSLLDPIMFWFHLYGHSKQAQASWEEQQKIIEATPNRTYSRRSVVAGQSGAERTDFRRKRVM